MKGNEGPILKSDVYIVAPCPKCSEDNIIPYLNTVAERVSCEKCQHSFSLNESVKYRILQRSFKGDYWMAFPFQTLLFGTDLVKTGRASLVKFPIKFKRFSGVSTKPFFDIRKGGNVNSTEFIVVSWGNGELINISWNAIGFTEDYPVWMKLFFEAIWHERNQNYRSAIVSGFTSWEVFITKKLTEILSNKFGKPCSNELVNDKSGIHLKTRYLELFDENLTYNDLPFTEKMSSIRNSVIHEGKETTFDDVKNFLKIMYRALMTCGVKPVDLLKVTVIRKKTKEDFDYNQTVVEDMNEKCYIAYNLKNGELTDFMISYSFENEKNGWQAKRTLYSTEDPQKLYREQYVDGEIRNHGIISFKYNGSEDFKYLVKDLINERDDIIRSYMKEEWLGMNSYRFPSLNLKDKNVIKEILESKKETFEQAIKKTLRILDNVLA